MTLNYSDPEVVLMDTIRKQWGAAIAEQCKVSSIRPDLIAALIANESGGDLHASRFEPAVFGKILEVCAGKRTNYSPSGIKNPITRDTLIPSLEKFTDKMTAGTSSFLWQLGTIVQLATSHGLTQIMGWHCLEFGRDQGIFLTAPGQIRFTIDILAYFAQIYLLDASKEDESLLRCWNTGRPDGATYDPLYCAKALRRGGYYTMLSDPGTSD